VVNEKHNFETVSKHDKVGSALHQGSWNELK